ncbi:MAG: MarR family winged helix-turn-helix transcriptional regulator [Pseudonocardiaceae bacterium]
MPPLPAIPGEDRDQVCQTPAAERDALLSAARAMMALTLRTPGALDCRVSPVQLRTLTVLDGMDTANLSELADELGISSSSTSRLCDRLVGAGLIDRRPSPQTRRKITLRLTRAGSQILSEFDQRRLDALTTALHRLPTARQSEVLAALRDFAAAILESVSARTRPRA